MMKRHLFFLISFAILNSLAGQIIYFVGQPKKILDHGDYKQNLEVGKYYYSWHDWEKAIEHFNQCSVLSRRAKHFSYLTRSYLYLNDLPQAKQAVKKIKNRQEKELLRLAILKISSYGEEPKISKCNIDRIIVDRQDVINRTKAKIIAMAKNQVPDFGE